MKRSMCINNDKDTHLLNKKKCSDPYWVLSGLARTTNKYVCCIHSNDQSICDIYGCRGKKINNVIKDTSQYILV